MKYAFALLSFFLLFFFSFSKAQTNTSYTIQHNGLTREYKVYVPAIYNGNTSVPLVFNLHGYTSNMTEQEVYGNFRPIADTANFILVHPNGTLDGSGNRYWNAFGFGADDVGFISLLIDHLSSQYAIDQNRIYSTGMSNGGFMSVELACALAGRITAVASVTGSMGVNKLSSCNPSKPTPVMQINGTSDMTVAYNGNAQYASIPNVVDFWVNKNGCNTVPLITNIPNINTTDGSTVEQYLYSDGDNGATVELFKVNGGGHTWPGAPIDIPISGNTNRDINASKEILRFFSQFKSDELVSIDDIPNLSITTIFPNPSSGEFTVQLDGKIEQLIVYDVMGRLIMPEYRSDVEFYISNPGVYFVHSLVNGELQITKICVEK